MTHSLVLTIAYASVCALWWGVSRVVPLWRDPERPGIPHPRTELVIAVVAVMAVLFLGQLWVQGIRLRAQRRWLPLAESVNQVLIFAPILVVPWLRGHGMATAWVQRSAILARLAVGLVLAMVALAIYAGLEAGAPGWLQTMRDVYAPTRLHLAVQVLLEDLSIAILFVRLAAVAGPRLAIVSVAALFAAAHVPTMVAQGATIPEFAGLCRDFGLGVLVLSTVWRSADIVWVWPVHYSLDMTQFLTGQA